MNAFWLGLAIGFVIMMPIGPMASLTIRRTLTQGRASGLASGAGVAAGDLLYTAIAAFGLPSLARLLAAQSTLLTVSGGALLVLIGIVDFRRPVADPAAPEDAAAPKTVAAAFLTSTLLALGQPATVLAYAAVFAALGAAPVDASATQRTLLVAGTFAGSVAWFAVLTALVLRVRSALTRRTLGALNVACSVLIAGFGLAAIGWALLHRS